MPSAFLGVGNHPDPAIPQEGALHSIIKIQDHVFHILYGYYEDCERENPEIDPMPIYPDFLQTPHFTKEGAMLVTKMQDACSHYRGKDIRERECGECLYYEDAEDLIGICTCCKNKRIPDAKTTNHQEELL